MTEEINVPIRAKYNWHTDVLYVLSGDLVTVEGDEGPDGVELDFSVDDGRPVGITVIGFKQQGWMNRIDKLACIGAAHLSVDPLQLMEIIDTALDKLDG